MLRYRRLWAIGIALLIALLMANRGLAPVNTGDDTGAYHMGAVAWNSAYAIVKGLGNLHGRFAYNTSHSLYAAILDIDPWTGKSYMFANRLLITVLLSQAVLSIDKGIGGRRPTYVAPFLLTLMLAPMINLAIAPEIAGLTPEPALAVLGVVILWNLAHLITTERVDAGWFRYRLFGIFALSAMGLTLKLSFAAFAFTACLVAAGVWYDKGRSRHTHREILATFAPAGLIAAFGVGMWIVRGVILSGYVAYPATLGAMPVSWRVPRPLALSEANWIRSWARLPQVPWIDVLGKWDWFEVWYHSLPIHMYKALALTGVALAFWAVRLVLRNRRTYQSLSLTWMLLVPPLAGILFWFVTAPAPRFAGSAFWLMAAAAILLAFDSETFARARDEKIARTLVAALVFVIAWQPLPSLLYSLPADGVLPPIPTAKAVLVQTMDGDPINATTVGDVACWNAELPCTPYFRGNLHLFSPGDLAAGFYLDDTVTYADFQAPALPVGLTRPADLGVALVSWQIPEHYPARIRDANNQLRFLLYTDRPGPINATFTFAPDPTPRAETDAPTVELLLNDRHIGALSVQEAPVTVDLQLQTEFNVLAIRPVTGGGVFSGFRFGAPAEEAEPHAPIVLLGLDFDRPLP